MLVEGPHGRAQGPAAEQFRLVLIQHPEVCRQAVGPLALQQVDVLPQQGRAEGVHGLDVRPVHPVELLLEVVVLRLSGQPLPQLLGNAAPELRRRGPGIGDDEEVVQVAVLLRDISEQPLYQHPCLAGAGGGGHQQVPAPVLHRGALLSGQSDIAHGAPSSVLSSMNCQNASGLMGRMYSR